MGDSDDQYQSLLHSASSSVAEPPAQQQTPSLYYRRWWLLFLLSAFNTLQAILWAGFGPLSSIAEEYYGCGDSTIRLFSIIATLCMAPALPLQAYGGARWGLRYMVLAAAGLGTVCAILHAVGPFVVPALVGSGFAGMAGVISLSAPPMLSAAWFGPKERTFATAVAELSNYNLGLILMYAVSLAIKTTLALKIMLWVEAAVALLLFVAILLYFPSNPPLSSLSQREGLEGGQHIKAASLSNSDPCLEENSSSGSIQTHDLNYDVQKPEVTPGVIELLGHFRRAFCNRSSLAVILSCAATMGVWGAWVIVLPLILTPLGFSDSSAQLVGLLAEVGGLFGGLCIGKIDDVIRHYRILMLVMYSVSTVVYVIFGLCAQGVLPPSMYIVLPLSLIGGMFVNGLPAVSYEALIELLYPLPIVVSATAVTLPQLICCTAFLFAGDYISPLVLNWILTGVLGFGALVCLIIREQYLRSTKVLK